VKYLQKLTEEIRPVYNTKYKFSCLTHLCLPISHKPLDSDD